MNILNKKGFTLIELIAVVSLIAIIAVIATPNIVNLVDSSKKENFVNDAKEMISKAIYKSKLDKYQELFTLVGNNCKEINLEKLEIDIITDPDGNKYDITNSSVKICNIDHKLSYYVKTSSVKKDGTKGRGVQADIDGYVERSILSKKNVKQIN